MPRPARSSQQITQKYELHHKRSRLILNCEEVIGYEGYYLSTERMIFLPFWLFISQIVHWIHVRFAVVIGYDGYDYVHIPRVTLATERVAFSPILAWSKNKSLFIYLVIVLVVLGPLIGTCGYICIKEKHTLLLHCVNLAKAPEVHCHLQLYSKQIIFNCIKRCSVAFHLVDFSVVCVLLQ